MSKRKYKLIFEIYDYQKDISDLKTLVQKSLSKYLSRCSISIKNTSKKCYMCHISGSLEDVDACHMLFNQDCLPQLHVIRSLDEAGDNIRTRAYPILSQSEQQIRAFINRVMTNVAGTEWWASWCPPGVDDKANMRQHSAANDHQIELVDFTDLMTLLTAEIQDWADDYLISAKDLAQVLEGSHDVKAFRDQVERRLTKRSAWDDIFLPYISDAAEWEDLKKELVGIIIPIRHRVMHHRPLHLYHLKKVKEHSRALRKQLDRSRLAIDEKQRKELAEINQDITHTLHRSVSRLNQELFGSSVSVRSLAQQQQAVQKSMAPIMEIQEQWRRQMRPWIEWQEQIRKQMEPIISIQEQWRKDIDKLTKGLR